MGRSAVAGLTAGQIYLETSTVARDTKRRIGSAVAEKGGHMLDVSLGSGEIGGRQS